MKKYIVSIITIIILVGLHFYMNPNPKKVIEDHLKNKYNEEFVVELLGKREKTYEAIIYPQKYVGTPKENDSYYWGRGFAKGRNGGDTYGLVLLNESTNEFFLPKLKELFGENVLPVFNMGPGYNKNNFKEELETMKKAYKEYPTANFEPISGGIYIFGRVEKDEDREWYRKQIYEFVQFMKQTGTFEYVDLGIVIWDERVLSEEFRTNDDLRREILVARNTIKDDKEFIKERKRLMKQTDESMKKLTKEEKEQVLNNYIKSDIYGENNNVDRIFSKNYFLSTKIYSPKYIENQGLRHREKTNYEKIEDVKFWSELY